MMEFSEADLARFLEAEQIDRENGVVHLVPSATPLPEEPIASRQRIILQWASDVTPERIEWLWTDRLPLHDLAVLAGEPGLGKSTTTAELAARITLGELSGALQGQPRSVLIATAEDHFESVVWGRLHAAEADMRGVANVTVEEGMLAIPDDVEALAATCNSLRQQGRPAALIVVDPIAAYLGGVDSHKDTAVRTALAPLAKLAQVEQVCVLAVAHLNKSSAGQLLSRISGSGAFGAAPRSVLAFARHPDDQDGEQGARRVIVHAKSNHGRYAPTLDVHIEAPMVSEVGATVSRLVVDGETDVGPEDLTGVAADRSSGEDVRDAIVGALTKGQRPSREVKAEVANACGVSARTVERSAAQMVRDEELDQRREGQPPIGIWSLRQLRHASSDTPVATDDVATGNHQYPRDIPALEVASCDAPGAVSQLTGVEPRSGETYEDWEARCGSSNASTTTAAHETPAWGA
jgi:hypothetical protein